MMRHVLLGFRSSWLGLLAVAILTFAAPLAALGASTKTVDILADSYDPKTFSVEAGTTVVFKNTSSFPHTATADGGSFDTGMISPGATKSVTLKKSGTFAFHCQFHGAVGGVGQSGTITVTAAAATTAPSEKPGDASVGGSKPKPTAPSSATLPELPGGPDGLPGIAFAIAGIGSIVLAVVVESVRGAARRRPGR